MRRWFLSYNSSDRALTEGLGTSIERKDAGSRVFFDATRLANANCNGRLSPCAVACSGPLVCPAILRPAMARRETPTVPNQVAGTAGVFLG
jgi:hypothetical protein